MHMRTGLISMLIFLLPVDRVQPSKIIDHFVYLNTGIIGAICMQIYEKQCCGIGM